MTETFRTPVTCEWEEGGHAGAHILVDATQREIAVCDTEEDCGELARCVNAHDGLVKALRDIAAMTDRCYPENDACDVMQDIAKEALAAAGEGET